MNLVGQLLAVLDGTPVPRHVTPALSWLKLRCSQLKSYRPATGAFQTQAWSALPGGHTFYQHEWTFVSWMRIRLWLAEALWSAAAYHPLCKDVLTRMSSRLVLQSMEGIKRDWSHHCQLALDVEGAPDEETADRHKKQWAQDVRDTFQCDFAHSSAGHVTNSDMDSILVASSHLDTLARDPMWNSFLLPDDSFVTSTSTSTATQELMVKESFSLQDLCDPRLGQSDLMGNWLSIWCTVHPELAIPQLLAFTVFCVQWGVPSYFCRTMYWMKQVLLLHVNPMDGCYQLPPVCSLDSPFIRCSPWQPLVAEPGYQKRNHLSLHHASLPTVPLPYQVLLETWQAPYLACGLGLLYAFVDCVQHISMDQLATIHQSQIPLQPSVLLLSLPNQLDSQTGAAWVHSTDGLLSFLKQLTVRAKLHHMDLSGLIGLPSTVWQEVSLALHQCNKLSYLKLRLRPGTHTTERATRVARETYGIPWIILFEKLGTTLVHLVTQHHLRTLVLEFYPDLDSDEEDKDGPVFLLHPMEEWIRQLVTLPRVVKKAGPLNISWIWCNDVVNDSNPLDRSPVHRHAEVHNVVGSRRWILSPDQALALAEKVRTENQGQKTHEQGGRPPSHMLFCTRDEYELLHFYHARKASEKHAVSRVAVELSRKRPLQMPSVILLKPLVLDNMKVEVSCSFNHWLTRPLLSEKKRNRYMWKKTPQVTIRAIQKRLDHKQYLKSENEKRRKREQKGTRTRETPRKQVVVTTQCTVLLDPSTGSDKEFASFQSTTSSPEHTVPTFFVSKSPVLSLVNRLKTLVDDGDIPMEIEQYSKRPYTPLFPDHGDGDDEDDDSVHIPTFSEDEDSDAYHSGEEVDEKVKYSSGEVYTPSDPFITDKSSVPYSPSLSYGDASASKSFQSFPLCTTPIRGNNKSY